MSLVAHWFGHVEFKISDIFYCFPQAGSFEKQNKYSKFEIRHVQIDVLPKTIDDHRFKKDQIIEYNALVSFFKFFVGNHVQ